MRLHAVLLSVSLAACVVLSAVSVFNPHFHPAQYPANALHWVAIVWALTITSESFLHYFVSTLASFTATVVLFLSVNSYFPEWSISNAFLSRVYNGRTRPYYNVYRYTQTDRDDDMYIARFGVTFVCAFFMLFSCCSHATEFWARSYTKVEDEDEPRPKTSYVSFGAACVIVVFDTVMGLLPYSRWIVVDSPHVALIAGLLVFSPKGTLRVITTVLMLFGVVISSFSLRRTIEATQVAHADWLSITSYRTTYVHQSFGNWYFEPAPSHSEDGGFSFSSCVLHGCEWVLLMLGAFIGVYRLVCG